MNKIKSKKDKIIEQNIIYRTQNKDLLPAIIVDIDGTVALINGRSPFDETKWHQDLPHLPIITLINFVVEGIKLVEGEAPTLIFMTGREGGEKNQAETTKWLKEHTPFVDYTGYRFKLYMREPGDYRGDIIVKKEMFEQYVQDYYHILWVFEDRNKMVNFWRNGMKLPTLQVKDGDY